LIEGEKLAGIAASFGTCRDPLRSLRDAILYFDLVIGKESRDQGGMILEDLAGRI
jgi:hypothetical protein